MASTPRPSWPAARAARSATCARRARSTRAGSASPGATTWRCGTPVTTVVGGRSWTACAPAASGHARCRTRWRRPPTSPAAPPHEEPQARARSAAAAASRARGADQRRPQDAAALEVFNASDHTRTVGGVARSLGAPGVCVRPRTDRPSVVSITVMWELSWYRFEVDLSDEAGGVRRDAQGDELSELPPRSRRQRRGR